jgi:hypothetical protein
MAKLHRHKIAFVSLTLTNNSVLDTEHRIKNNTEYRTSVQKLLCYNNNKENSEKKQTQKQLFTVTAFQAHDKLTETQNSKQ